MTTVSVPSALFLPVSARSDSETFHATQLTSGPWRPDAQHGGPPSALLARALERLLDAGQFLARVSIELVKGVPLGELRVDSARERVSGRVWHGTAELFHGDLLVARGRGLILTGGEVPEPEWRPVSDARVRPDTAPAVPPAWAQESSPLCYHRDAVDHVFERGSFDTPGDAIDWVRLRYPLVEGEATSGVSLALAVADFGSGVSAIYDYQKFGLINADVDVVFVRPVEGEWVMLEAVTRVGTQGTGLCVTELSDIDGYFGTASQALLGYGPS